MFWVVRAGNGSETVGRRSVVGRSVSPAGLCVYVWLTVYPKYIHKTNCKRTEALAGMKTTEEILVRSEELKASALVFKKVWQAFLFFLGVVIGGEAGRS